MHEVLSIAIHFAVVYVHHSFKTHLKTLCISFDTLKVRRHSHTNDTLGSNCENMHTHMYIKISDYAHRTR